MRCTGCKVCQVACPNGSIIIKDQKGEVSKKKELQQFIWRLDTCTFCNLCVQACPHFAIEFTGDFESSVYDRRLLAYGLNDYAGAYAKLMAKVEDPEEREKMTSPLGRYEGPLPLAGHAMSGLRALGEVPKPEPEPEKEAPDAS
jgi:formate hydrogenlyase subunit 6/NADH:ubiquinone oxidoreductase subunit I